MIRFLFALLRRRDGTTAVEFALVLPAFLGLVFGTVEYGRLLWTREALQEIAASSARCMAVRAGDCASSGAYSAWKTTSYVQTLAAERGLSLPSTDISLAYGTTCGGASGFSSVTVTETFTSVVPKIVMLPGNGTTLDATACFPDTP
jgi:Flp pilus assembly protein TadG